MIFHGEQCGSQVENGTLRLVFSPQSGRRIRNWHDEQAQNEKPRTPAAETAGVRGFVDRRVRPGYFVLMV
jgi:hypothetical protein